MLQAGRLDDMVKITRRDVFDGKNGTVLVGILSGVGTCFVLFLVILGTVWLRRAVRPRRRPVDFSSTNRTAVPALIHCTGEKALHSQTSKESNLSKTSQSKQSTTHNPHVCGSPQSHPHLVSVHHTSSPTPRKLAHCLPTPQFPSFDMWWQVDPEGRSDLSLTHCSSTNYSSSSPTCKQSGTPPQLASTSIVQHTPRLLPNYTKLLAAQNHAHRSASFESPQSHVTAVSSGRSRMAIIKSSQPLGESTSTRPDHESQLAQSQARSISARRIPDIIEIQDAMLSLRSPHRCTGFAVDNVVQSELHHLHSATSARGAHLACSPSSSSHPQVIHCVRSRSTVTMHSAHSSNPSVSSSAMFSQQQSMMTLQPTFKAVDFGDVSGQSSAASSMFAPSTPVFGEFKHESASFHPHSIAYLGMSPIKRTSTALPDLLFSRASTVDRDSQHTYAQNDVASQSPGLPQPHHAQPGKGLGSTISAYGQAL